MTLIPKVTITADNYMFKVNNNKRVNNIKKETLAQVFSCEFCESFKNTFLYGTPPVAVSGLFKTLVQMT